MKPTKILPHCKFLTTRHIVAQNLRLIRAQQSRTQDDVAYEADISQSYLGKIEKGDVNISVETLGNLASALRVDAMDLLNWPNVFRTRRELPLFYQDYYARLTPVKRDQFCRLLDAILEFREGVEE